MKQRAVTALFFVAVVLGGIYGGRETFFVLCCLIAAGGIWEFLELQMEPGTDQGRIRKILGTAAGVLPVALAGAGLLFGGPSKEFGPLAAQWTAQGWLLGFEMVVVAGFLLADLFTGAEKPFQHLGAVVLSFFYVSLPVILLLSLATSSGFYRPNCVFGLLWLVWSNDTSAYLVGSQIGRTKLFERISPKKTWEGTLGGVAGTVLMAWLLARYYTDFTPIQWVALGAVVSIFGTLGDLVESMLKRSAGVKDSGTLLPGHGGILDRFDSFLFMLPFAWLAVLLLS